MSVAPSAIRGELALSPSYFSSSLFVHPLREDILHLIRLFQERYAQTRPSQPFTLFKAIWKTQGWTWMHLKVFDARSREAFLGVTARLFLGAFRCRLVALRTADRCSERTATTETPLARTAALFGLYTFFFTQPTPSAHHLYSISHVPIPIGTSTVLLWPTLTYSHRQLHCSHGPAWFIDIGGSASPSASGNLCALDARRCWCLSHNADLACTRTEST
jgi:hypothetical protein